MFGRLMPKEVRYFDYFNAHSEQLVLGGQSLVALMVALIESPDEAPRHAEDIDRFERAADEIIRKTVSLLHTSFITPFDRDEIHQLINGMDDVLDLIQDIAESMTLYDIHRVTPEAKTLAELASACCVALQTAVKGLHQMRNAPVILKACKEISELESEADRVLREAMSKLFRDEPDVRQVIKLKAIYELLETVTDRCKDVSYTVEGIVLENS